MNPVNRSLGHAVNFYTKKIPTYIFNNPNISKEESISGKIPKSNLEISKRLPPVHRELLRKPKKNSPWNSFRIPWKAETIYSSIQKAKNFFTGNGSNKNCQQRRRPPKTRWVILLILGHVFSWRSPSIISVNGFSKQYLHRKHKGVSATSMY